MKEATKEIVGNKLEEAFHIMIEEGSIEDLEEFEKLIDNLNGVIRTTIIRLKYFKEAEE